MTFRAINCNRPAQQTRTFYVAAVVTVLSASFFMATLCNRGAIIFLPCNFYLLLLLFFPRLISAATNWMSTILLHMAWP